MHGFALNVRGDLSPFDVITPCGIAGVTMTSIEKETEATDQVQEVAERVAALAKERIMELFPPSVVMREALSS